jgi:hypothetical protein
MVSKSAVGEEGNSGCELFMSKFPDNQVETAKTHVRQE